MLKVFKKKSLISLELFVNETDKFVLKKGHYFLDLKKNLCNAV